MRFPMVALLVCTVLLSAAAPPPDSPMAQVHATADKILNILKDPKLQGDAGRPERQRLIREELEQRFDWAVISRSCLGRHWAKLSKQEQRDFVDLFKRFLERTYLDRVEPYYNELDHIEYQGERIAEANYASVRTAVVTRQMVEHPVEYRLQRSSSGMWRVYDVVIEGVSLVKNYRTQFDEILNNSSFQALMNDLKAKTNATHS
jgi:phospholipid transport system substrate-binding protein